MSPTQKGSQIAALRFWFGLDRGAASVLAELIRANGAALSRHALAASCDMSLISVRVRITELRCAMVVEAIDTTPHGYSLTEHGREECRIAFDAVRQDLKMMEMAA